MIRLGSGGVIGVFRADGGIGLHLREREPDAGRATVRATVAEARGVAVALTTAAADETHEPLLPLTVGQVVALQAAADGLTTPEAAAARSVSVETEKTLRRQACERMGARTITHAVALATRAGIVEPHAATPRWAVAA